MNAAGLGRLLDGRPHTAWTTRRPQAAGDRLRVTFGKPEAVTAVALQSSPAFAEFPRTRAGAPGRGCEWSQPPPVERPLERWRTMEALMTRPIEAPL